MTPAASGAAVMRRSVAIATATTASTASIRRNIIRPSSRPAIQPKNRSPSTWARAKASERREDQRLLSISEFG